MTEPAHLIHASGSVYGAPRANHPLASFYNGSARKVSYLPGIEPDLAPWAQLLGRVVDRFGLDHYPEGALRAALANFEQQHGRIANPATDWDSVADLVAEHGGWVQ
ncbi:hypothetical protein ACFXP7_08350 [Microbacterium sp. P06]|uniref:hypothetical protein n=1 Tax=Microbacterium sp. P06 TaxID=3366949 RepID=UPI003745B7AE